MTSFFWTNLRN